jgi:hypothetical protein
MSRFKRHELTFPVSQRDRRAQAIVRGSKSELAATWKQLQGLLENGERVFVEWKKQEFGNRCSMLVENEDDLLTMIKGILLHGAYDVTFYAEPKTAARPPHTPRGKLFY